MREDVRIAPRRLDQTFAEAVARRDLLDRTPDRGSRRDASRTAAPSVGRVMPAPRTLRRRAQFGERPVGLGAIRRLAVPQVVVLHERDALARDRVGDDRRAVCRASRARVRPSRRARPCRCRRTPRRCQLNAAYFSASGSSGMTVSVAPSIWMKLRSMMQTTLSSSSLPANIIASQCNPAWCSASEVTTNTRQLLAVELGGVGHADALGEPLAERARTSSRGSGSRVRSG